ncbi:uncharacterized protein LOC117175255 isoform X2 [Belonocnema kinseyi]|uniref:uncharacterized protein LOC117175255 isoform X2 n=1 Tax=Belonocnema kinseyi TaxID=2817044 RepID=UPI00143CC21F|nr:uncharacterized protein LOC117175255 isoform X2 [Belonocnema kinseyi]
MKIRAQIEPQANNRHARKPKLLPIMTLPYQHIYMKHWRGLVDGQTYPFSIHTTYLTRGFVLFGWLHQGKILPIYTMAGHAVIYNFATDDLSVPEPEKLRELGVFTHWPRNNLH